MKKLILALSLIIGCSPAFAGVGDFFKGAGADIVDNSRVTLLEQAEIGWGWNLRDDSSGAPMALLGVWRYRFINLNVGWHDPFGKSEGREGVPSVLFGVHLDKMTRMIAPNSSDFVKGIVPELLRPAWDKLTLSYGPGYDLDRGQWSHFLGVNFLFGGN